jgi:large repetitive protein
MSRSLLWALRWLFILALGVSFGSAQALYVLRYSGTTNGAVTFTGNTLGLNKATGANTPGNAGSIGAFISNNNALTTGGFPAGSPSGGTTPTWTLNGSSAPLVMPAGSTVLYAELVWSASYAYGGVSVAASLGNAVTFTTPSGSFSVTPAAGTSQTLGTAGPTSCTSGTCYYVRSQDVTAQVLAGGAGLYSLGGVPGTVGATENNTNAAGWTLAVVYGNATLPARNLTVFVGAEQAGSAAAPVSGFCTAPTGTLAGRLMVSALEGDSSVTGDRMKFGPTLATLGDLSGPNNPIGNFFASQINKDDGTVATGGSYGTYNITTGSATVGRQGYDITNVDITARLVNGQTSALAQGTTTGDNYMINALGIQINVAAPSFPTATKTANKAVAKVGETISYTVVMNNVGTNIASSVVFTDTPPPGTSFVAGTLSVDNVLQPAANPSAGVAIGTIAAGTTKTIKFDVLVNSIPAAPAVAQFSNTASWTYTYVSCVGEPAVNGSLTTAPAVTNIARLEPTKAVSPSGTVAPGQQLTYTISVPNTGTANSAGSTLADAIPAGTTYVAGSTTLNGVVVADVAGAMPFATAAAINSATRPAGQINAGETATVSFKVTVNPGVSTSITNTANADVDGAGGAPAASAQVVSPVARLLPTKAVSPVGAVAPGQVMTYTITVPNSGTGNTAATTLADAIPAGTTYVAGSTTLNGVAVADVAGVMPFATAAAINSPTRAPGQINASETATIVFRVTLNNSPGIGPIVNTASIDPDGPGSAAALTAQASSPVLLPNMLLTKSHVGNFAVGAVGSYTLQASNLSGAGQVTAGPITVIDSLPTGLTVAALPTGTNWNCAATVVGSNTATCTYSGAYPVAGGTALAPITLQVNVAAAAVPSVTNNATLTPVPGETATVNNSANDPTTVLLALASDLRLSKTHTGPFVVGSTGSYTLTVDNGLGTGPTSGTVTVTDTLPVGLSYVPAGSGGAGWTCGVAGAVVTCTSSTVIAAGGTGAPITLNVAVASVAVPSVTNLASVSGGGEPIANAGNNDAADFTVVDLAPQNTFAPDGNLTGAPGTVVSYPHVFNAAIAGTVSFSTLSAPSPAIAGWSNVIYRDDDCNGVLNGSETSAAPLTGTVAVTAGAQVCIVVREFIPATATLNATDTLSVRALFTPSGPGSSQTLTRTDITTVTGTGAGLVLAKSVRNVTTGGVAGTSNVAASGHTLEYTITYTNNGSVPLGNIVVTDSTPAFSNFVLAACSTPLPATLSGCTVSTQPSVGGSGGMSWTLSGSLAPGASGSVTFRVTVQ